MKKQRRSIPRRQEGILIESWEDLDLSINYRNEMAICTKIRSTTYDGTPLHQELDSMASVSRVLGEEIRNGTNMLRMKEMTKRWE